jgi:hypothetical protein
MGEAAAKLHVEIEDNEIVVMKCGTRYLLAYRRSLDQRRIVLTRSWMAPTAASAPIKEFRAQAFQAANEKAREIGWIV